MRIGDMVKQLADPNTSRQRKEDIIRQLNELGDREEKYQRWLTISGGGVNPDALRQPLDRKPYFVHWFDSTPANQFPVNTSTFTALNLTDSRLTIRNDSPCVVRMSGTKIYPSIFGSYVFISGRIFWAVSATNFRSAHIAYYDSTNTLILRRSLNDVQAISGNGTSVLMSNVRPATSNLSTDLDQYFQIEVFQSSGGSLNVAGIDLGIELAFF